MKKLLLMIITITVIMLLPSTKAHAYDEPLAGISVVLDAVKENHIDTAIAYYSTIYRIDSNLVLAIIDGESDGNIRAFNTNDNGSHDKGLMQINSCNYEWLETELGITDFYDPIQNIQAGIFILADIMKNHSDYHEILMCYNMGWKRTRELHAEGIYSSKYSRKVMRNYQILKGG